MQSNLKKTNRIHTSCRCKWETLLFCWNSLNSQCLRNSSHGRL